MYIFIILRNVPILISIVDESGSATLTLFSVTDPILIPGITEYYTFLFAAYN